MNYTTEWADEVHEYQQWNQEGEGTTIILRNKLPLEVIEENGLWLVTSHHNGYVAMREDGVILGWGLSEHLAQVDATYTEFLETTAHRSTPPHVRLVEAYCMGDDGGDAIPTEYITYGVLHHDDLDEPYTIETKWIAVHDRYEWTHHSSREDAILALLYLAE